MSERDLLNAPRAYALLTALRVAHVDVNPGTGLHIALMEFAHVEATKTADLVAELERCRKPMVIELKTSEEARRLIDTVASTERETIKALADALADTAPVVGADGPCWCDPMMDKKNGRHWERGCVERRAALRLAGRLP